jgi:trans-AT polyketide synthase/acyltransferase/oxidoreductase domain-containing protein
MGKERFDVFAKEVALAESILGYNLQTLCLEDPEGLLHQTQFTQPALYVVNALHYWQHLRDHGQPQYLAGHSLGEYNALHAAGVFDFETGLRLVQQRGKLMSMDRGGGMAAVVGLDLDKLRNVLEDKNAVDVDFANFNAPSQAVLSGPIETLEKLVEPIEAAGARRCLVLKVSAAFHSRYMQESAIAFKTFLSSFTFKPPQIPVIANVTARPYPADEMITLLADQICSSVQWCDSMRYLIAKGVDDVVELGPGRVLTNLYKKIRKEAAPLDLDEPQASPDPPPAPSVASPPGLITPESLGNRSFCEDFGVRYAYVQGSMYKGIASPEMVIRMGKAGLLGFFGTGGLSLTAIESGLQSIQAALGRDGAYGLNLLNNLANPKLENETVALYLKYGVRNVEAAAFMLVSEGLVHFRYKGAYRDAMGRPCVRNRVIAKVSRPEVANAFMSPAPAKILTRLVESGKLTADEAELATQIPVSHHICVEADSGGHTDMGVAYTLMPAMLSLRDRIQAQHGYAKPIQIGAAGGIGSPESAAAAFMLGAEFILTGSINQCTPQAGTSDLVKDMLQVINVQDTDYAPAGDMFEMGAKVQVVRRGVFFPARAKKLYDLYRQVSSLEAIDGPTKKTIEEKYFKRSFEDVWQETQTYYQQNRPKELEKAERNPKHKMALIFKWYFVLSNRLALAGDQTRKVDFQIHCGPALGAFNQWVKDTDLEAWQNRDVDVIAERLMQATAETLNRRLAQMTASVIPTATP